MTRIILIVLTWVLLGVLFFFIKNECCGSKAGTKLPAATSIDEAASTQATLIDSSKSLTIQSTDSTINESEDITPTSNEVNVDDLSTGIYNYDAYATIKKEDNKSIIPFSDEANLNVEVQALLEETCSNLANSMSKVQITAFGVGKDSYMRKMENFLIRCGLSPGRVALLQKSANDVYNKQIVLEVIN